MTDESETMDARSAAANTRRAWTTTAERPGTVRSEWHIDEVGAASVSVDSTQGARLSSLTVSGHELLADAGAEATAPFGNGCFAMVPYAGRVESGRFSWRGIDYALPVSAPPHAAHGVTADVVWAMTAPGRFETELDGRWPFGGWARQEVRCLPSGLELELTVGNENREMPASIGFHPWFRSHTAGRRARLDWPSHLAYAEETPQITSRRLVPTPDASTWCAPARDSDPIIRWPGFLTMTLSSSQARCWVVHESESSALCVEPQTAPGNALRVGDADVVAPGRPLTLRLRLEFHSDKEATRAAA